MVSQLLAGLRLQRTPLSATGAPCQHRSLCLLITMHAPNGSTNPHGSLAAHQQAAKRQPRKVQAAATPMLVPSEVAEQALEEQPAECQQLERSLQLPAQPQPSTSGRQVLESPDELKSTLKHRLWVWGATALLSGIGAQGLSELHSWQDMAAAGGAAFAAFVLAGVLLVLEAGSRPILSRAFLPAFGWAVADLGTAFYHFGVDNYGDRSTPVVGEQIFAFQGHHQRPWTITMREPCNNLHKVFIPTVPFSCLWLALTPWTPGPLDIGIATFVALVALSQQFHSWAHMKRSELPTTVAALQDAGVLLSRKAHGAHHKAPFENNYAIVSGWWNPLLDAGGDGHNFWRKFEHFIKARTGAEPRCWYEPKYEVEERLSS